MSAQRTEPLRLLVVDDDPCSVECLRTLLEHEGFAVTALDSPQVALQLLDARPFDAIITDLEMPGVNGLEVIRHAHAAQPGAIVFVLTGCGDATLTFAALALGARRVLDKPLEYALLSHELQSMSHAGSAARSAHARVAHRRKPRRSRRSRVGTCRRMA